MIELGGNIKLINFEKLEPALLIVVKKIVGNYTKKISETLAEFKSIEVSLNDENLNQIMITVEADKKYESEAKDKNLFFALNAALHQILNP